MITTNNKDIKAILSLNNNKEIIRITDTITSELVWEKQIIPLIDYLYVQNTYSGQNTVSITTASAGSPSSSAYSTTVEISKNGRDWTTKNLVSGNTITVTLNQNEKLYFRNDTGKFNYYSSSSNYFATTITATQSHIVGGNTNTLIDYDDLTTTGGLSRLFYENTTLTSSADLHITDTNTSTAEYTQMFYGCTAMTSTLQNLPATTISASAYYSMYHGCTSLTNAPSISATSVALSGCNQMFRGCSSLVTPPSTLPATTLANSSYISMFRECTSLTSTPTLPATTVPPSAYQAMFSGCTSLTTVNTISATSVDTRGMYSMFSGCTSLTSASIPATTVGNEGFRQMFYNCSSFNSITVEVSDISATDCTLNWLYGVANVGTVYNNGRANFTIDSPSGIPVNWSDVRPAINYFFVKNEYAGTNTVRFNASGSASSGTYTTKVEYSKDKQTWTEITVTNSLTLQEGETVWYRNNNGKWSYYNYGGRYIYLTTTQNCSVGGNINTLLDYENTNTVQLPQGCFASLFASNGSKIQSFSVVLPSTTLSTCCYYSMFKNCSNLTTAPSLPATTLAMGCYDYMFENCSGLTTAPALQAATLASYCYRGMFEDCTSLTTSPVLPSTTLASYCYYGMFDGCTSLATAPALPATTLADGCYSYMFSGCTSLTTAPTLPAATLVSGCYSQMFDGCTSLNSVTTYATNVTGTTNWLRNVANTGTFNNMGPANFTIDSPNGIPVGWTSVSPQYTVTITYDSSANGHTSINGTDYYSTYINTVQYGTSLTLEAIPDNGYQFNYWSDSNTNNPRTLVVTGNTTIRPYFELIPLEPFYIQNTSNYSDYIEITSESDGYSQNHATSVYYSTDRSNWTEIQLVAGSTTTLYLGPGEKIWFENYDSYWNEYTDDYNYFITRFGQGNSGGDTFIVGGDITSLSNGILSDHCFHKLFYRWYSVYDASNLILPDNYCETYCYSYMFGNCYGLTTTPSLPSTYLAQYCYYYMFNGCDSLTTAPSLPATTLAEGCYYKMFGGTSITTAPSLPATTLVENCYAYMFNGCMDLTSITIYADDNSASGCTYMWLLGTDTGTIHNLGSATYQTGSASGVPNNWTIVNN